VPRRLDNHPSAKAQPSFVASDIAKLLETGAARECDPDFPICISPLGVVPKAGNKFRLILDLRHVNGYLKVPAFKYEGLEAVSSVLAPGDWLATVDLRAGYHHVDLNEDAIPYMGFQWAECPLALGPSQS
jgi:hypothetical protein